MAPKSKQPLLAPEVLEPRRRQFCVADSVLDVAVPKVSLIAVSEASATSASSVRTGWTDGTIAENIAYGDRWATKAKIALAALAANAAEFIDRLPDRYETLISSSMRLSGGQRQRLAIARAILADPTC